MASEPVVAWFFSRIAIVTALVFGYGISFFADRIFGRIAQCTGTICHEVFRVDRSGVGSAKWIGLPHTVISPTSGELSGPHLPAFKITFILLIIPSIIALLAENAGQSKRCRR